MDIISTLLPLILIFGIFYFILIRPQQRKMKKHQNMLNNLAKGARCTGRMSAALVG